MGTVRSENIHEKKAVEFPCTIPLECTVKESEEEPELEYARGPGN
jgi:hypothetical protein